MSAKQRKINPKSLENLTHEGRPPAYDEPKEGHQVSVTTTGWAGFRSIADQLDISVSELIERFGRGQLVAVMTEVSLAELREHLGQRQIVVLGANRKEKSQREALKEPPRERRSKSSA